MTLQGTHKARAKEWGLGHSSSGKEQIAILFEITQGPCVGKTITWFGYFTEASTDRTLDTLRYCGWDGDNFADLVGLDANEVELVVEPDTYEGKTRDRVKWVNRPARLALREQMSPAATAAFAASMRAKAIAHKQAHGPARATASTAPASSSGWRPGPTASQQADAENPFPGDDIPF